MRKKNNRMPLKERYTSTNDTKKILIKFKIKLNPFLILFQGL